MKTKTSPTRNSMTRSRLRHGLFLTALVLACFALPRTPNAFGVDPPPDGGYANQNTAEGEDALFSLTTGIDNTAAGFNALYSNTTGIDNTANGLQALGDNTTGNYNTATGKFALSNNTTGSKNAANGFNALSGNTTGSFNIALGAGAGANLTTGNNNICIGNTGATAESNKIRIGTTGTQRATFIAGISGVTVPAGVGVIVGTDGKLGTVVSSERFKTEIKQMDKASEAILPLKPVNFRSKPEH